MKTLAEIIELSADYLEKNGVENGRQECEWVIAHVLDVQRLSLRVHGERVLSEDELAKIRPLLKRRAQREPLQYILGTTDFFNCQLVVGPGVLIPRSDTERLVELALERLRGNGEILDLCTGSGCIPLAMAKERNDIVALTGVDISDTALDWARKNRDLLDLKNVHFVQGDLYAPVEGMTFEMITANPPYIAEAERDGLMSDVVDYEPELALFAEDDGLDVLRRIAKRAPEFLIKDGWLLCEIGYEQGEAAAGIFREAGFLNVEVVKDYGSNDRVVVGQKA